jgi:hypothetical protein
LLNPYGLVWVGACGWARTAVDNMDVLKYK